MPVDSAPAAGLDRVRVAVRVSLASGSVITMSLSATVLPPSVTVTPCVRLVAVGGVLGRTLGATTMSSMANQREALPFCWTMRNWSMFCQSWSPR